MILSGDADSGHESISDEENDVASNFLMSGATEDHRSYYPNLQHENQDEASWFEILEEADELVCLLNRIQSSSFSNISEAGKTHKGSRGKDKLKFSIRSHLHREELCGPSSIKDGSEKSLNEAIDGPLVLEQITREQISVADILGDLQGEIDGFHTKFISLEQSRTIPSVVELLEDLQGREDLQGKDAPSNGASDLLLNVKAKEIKSHLTGKRMMSSLGSRTLDNEDPPESLGSGMSSEDEVLLLCLFRCRGRYTLLKEAFNRSTVEEPLLPINKQLRHGFHGRLQQVLQIEKDGHLEFLKKSQKGFNSYDESRSIDVQILSRVLEGKLIVCHCLFDESLKSCANGSDNCAGDGGTTRMTIIFSLKICDNVELEVGNSVCIHPPWKEVQINDDDTIILCVHFSQSTVSAFPVK